MNSGITPGGAGMGDAYGMPGIESSGHMQGASPTYCTISEVAAADFMFGSFPALLQRPTNGLFVSPPHGDLPKSKALSG